ncbi:MAG: lysylphosphatidylglycerol synthase transmembrane domain-containing protein [Candidatus Latescibacteria bacterium]|nr:lysylphosphatidylglycerol synthase transmembrane domain-containing protein [Candidatus Latescibacterota bacterium]
MKTGSRWVTLGLKIAVSAGLIALAFWQVDRAELSGAFTDWRVDPLVVALVLFVISNLFGAFQWGLLLKGQEISKGWKDLVRIYLVGVFLNNFMVGNLAGDVVRVYDVRQMSGRGAEALVATVMDRFLGLFAMMFLAGVGCLIVFIAKPDGHPPLTPLAPVVAAVYGSFAVLGVLLTSRRAGGFVDRLLIWALPESVSEAVANVRSALNVYRTAPRVLFLATLISLGVQFLRIVVHFACGLAVGLNVSLLWFVLFIPLISVVAMLPISVGGLGPRENAAIRLFGTVAAPAAPVIVMELLAHLVTLLSSLPGGIAFVLGRRKPIQAVESERDHD